ncbi:MAG: hypothetical protein WCD23_03365, partial [Candidatus Acidiferrales bacterium]
MNCRLNAFMDAFQSLDKDGRVPKNDFLCLCSPKNRPGYSLMCQLHSSASRPRHAMIFLPSSERPCCLADASARQRSVRFLAMNPLDISPDEFHKLAGRVAEIAAEYLKDLDARAIPPQAGGAELERLFHTAPPEAGFREDAVDDLLDVVRHSRSQNGRFFGYVLGSGEPVAAVADLLCSVLNQNVTAWRSAPAGATLE